MNRTIAVFDNDTAAASATKSLERIPLPAHLRVLKLPDLAQLRNYPTIGPSGAVAMDVNGVAASIELYLGDDVLADGSGLIPVQWTGFDGGLRRYQGEVVQKDLIHERFFRKVERARAETGALESSDWRGLRSILEEVFAAFHVFDNMNICDWARSYNAR